MWPAKRDPYPAGPAVGAPPIVVVGTTNDPATPYEAGVRLAARMPGAVLVTNVGGLNAAGGGHATHAARLLFAIRSTAAYTVRACCAPTVGPAHEFHGIPRCHRGRPCRGARGPLHLVEPEHRAQAREDLRVRARYALGGACLLITATLAMLVPSEDSNMDSDRLASAHRTEGVRSVRPATASSHPAMSGFNMNSSAKRAMTRSVKHLIKSLE